MADHSNLETPPVTDPQVLVETTIDTQQTGSNVYRAILGMIDDLAKVGVGKERRNEQQQFQYRGIDDVRDAVAPCLAKNHLIILPQVISREMTERQSRNGSALFYVLLQVKYEFLCPDDGSTKLVGPIYGEAMDSSDKATNKAMSAAYKVMCIDTFCIRTKGEESSKDADATVHDVAPEPVIKKTEPVVTEVYKPVIQKNWDGSKLVGFSKQFHTLPWSEVPKEFLEWCNVEGTDKLNSFQQECARLEQLRRDRSNVDQQDLPESFFAAAP